MHTIQQMPLFRLNRFLIQANVLNGRLCEAQFGLTRREWSVLAALANSEGLLSSELAVEAQLDRARTSKALTSLEAKGWVCRTPVAGDRRRIAITLTPQGRQIYAQVQPAVAQLNLDLLSALAGPQRRQFDEILSLLQARVQELARQERYVSLPRVDRGRQGG